jgi:hypothetical protein
MRARAHAQARVVVGASPQMAWRQLEWRQLEWRRDQEYGGCLLTQER